MPIILLIIYFLANSILASPTCKHGKTSFQCVSYLSNYDGDTIKFSIPETHPLLGDAISVRLKGVDTAEIRSKDPCEKKLAIFVRDKVAGLLKNAKRIDLLNVERGKYFRIVAEVHFDGVNLSKLLLEESLAFVYEGGTKTPRNWCKLKSRDLK